MARGEEITISYIKNDGYAAWKRREILASDWLFFCQCDLCSLQAAPKCVKCMDQDMEVIVSGLREELYPGHGVDCDMCQEDELQRSLGYFYHCYLCEADLCPACSEHTQKADSYSQCVRSAS
eukprot:TRINITY_DN83560_c0_g1_i1.p1 TRINITY_DN83560_c0_g1~~TRINITY_DN83560_c0_g1_i1.p1  ORF type:complete len:133 (-),score=17.31 TRINITY_DN83560_c0_g1_i1:62-427(-)